MKELLYPLVLLACPVGMGLMMWFMMRGTKASRASQAGSGTSATDAEVASLRAELDQLRTAQRDHDTPPDMTTGTTGSIRST